VNEKPAFIQGVYAYEGCGLERPVSFQPRVTYLVPTDRRSQTVYFRAGNASPELIYLVLTRRGEPMRYFPVGAKAAVHVPLAVLEDISPETRIELLVAAPAGMKSSVVLDIGFMEIA
jgi:hypothetical protein